MNALKGRRPLLVGIGMGVLALLVLVVLVMPKMSEVKKQQKALDAAVKSGQQLTAQVGELEDAKRQAASVKKQLGKLELARIDALQFLVAPCARRGASLDGCSEGFQMHIFDARFLEHCS